MVGSCGICTLLPLSVLVAPRVVFVAFCWEPCYAGNRKESSFSVASNGRRIAPPSPGGGLLAPSSRKEGVPMLTYSELFQFCLVIIGICGLFLQVHNGKKK